MKGTFVIVSVSDRLRDLDALITQLWGDKRFESMDIAVYFQDNKGVAHLSKARELTNYFVIVPQMEGCHGARVRLLRRIVDQYDFFINLDDDMEMTEWTRYRLAIHRSLQKGVGFVLTNWARTELLTRKKAANMRDIFVPQIMCYNGGGMVYSREVANLIVQLEPIPTAFDCAWPLTSYLNGYENLSFKGSLAIHRILGTGGMKVFMRNTPASVMGACWLNFRKVVRPNGTCMDYCIPLDGDVLPAAREMHRINRFALLNTGRPKTTIIPK